MQFFDVMLQQEKCAQPYWQGYIPSFSLWVIWVNF